MWNDQSAQGGGFFNSPNQFGAPTTPSANAQKTGKRSSRTAPVVITQALHCGDEGVRIWGKEVQIVSVVARVRSIRLQSTKITYTLQDMTGRMKAILWVDQDSAEEDDKVIPKVEVNEYVQVYGSVKNNKGKKALMIFKVMPVTSANAITFHYLQCLQNKLKAEADSKKEKVGNMNGTSVGGGLPSGSMMGLSETGAGLGGSTVMGLNPRQALVFNLIRASSLEQGTSKTDMFQALKDKMSLTEFEGILEWMCGEGHIYSTIDEEHYRATEAC